MPDGSVMELSDTTDALLSGGNANSLAREMEEQFKQMGVAVPSLIAGGGSGGTSGRTAAAAPPHPFSNGASQK